MSAEREPTKEELALGKAVVSLARLMRSSPKGLGMGLAVGAGLGLVLAAHAAFLVVQKAQEKRGLAPPEKEG